MAEAKETLPLIPMRNIVVFPQMTIPLYVGRKSSLEALEKATASANKLLLLSSQKDANIDEPAAKDLYNIGTLVKVIQLLRLPNGTVKVLVEGLSRVRLTEITEEPPFFVAGFEKINDIYKIDKELENTLRQVVAKFDSFVKVNKKVPIETLMSIINVEDPARLSDLMVAYLNLEMREKQQLLETLDVKQRLGMLLEFLTREGSLLEVEKDLQEKVSDQIEKVQKEYYLKEKLKAIQKELGTESETSEDEEYRKKIAEAKLPEDIEKKILREVARLTKLQSVSAEAGVIRTYIDWLLDLPWHKETKSEIDLKKVIQVLNQEHYSLEKVKDRILEYLAVYQTTNRQSGSIILLVGPPGVGKTSIAQAVAEALNRNFQRITLGGMRDEAELRGHRKTYVGAFPGKIIQALVKAKSKNPLILLDEIDKIARDYKGDPAAALMEILDPVQNKYFTDNYLEVPFDLSQIFFIATANTVYDISRPLLDRMEVIRLSGYSEDEKLEIAREFLLPKLQKKHGIAKGELDFTAEGIKMIINEYTREAGLRDLERSLAEICRKYVRNKLEKKKLYKKISRHNMHHYLGIPKFRKENLGKKDELGMVNGLAWTENGGEVLPVEASVLNGKGELTLTGHMGDIMQESAKAALTFIRSRYQELGLAEDFYKKIDVHVHISEGAIPKDGPSAGITIATAIASALSGLPVKGDIAMTGEITLRGRVLQIGGLKEKILAALRAGIDTILIPIDNKPELQEINNKIKRKIKFIPVKTMDEVMLLAIKGYPQGINKKRKINPEIFDQKNQDNLQAPDSYLS